MNTRYQKTPGPLSQSRYMSSAEFTELHGVSGVAVSARVAVLLHASKRNLIWFIQGLSLAEGGLKRVARELVEMFPDRISRQDAKSALQNNSKPNAYHENWHNQTIEEFLVDLCINPRLHFSAPSEEVDVSDIESESAIEQNPQLSKNDFRSARLNYFKDIIGALFEYQKRHEQKVRENFQLTTIGKKIWATLDYALAVRGMVVLDGLEGRGKTEGTKAWCELHLGQARFVSLKGIANKTTAFRAIAKALGIASSYMRTATEMQARIEDVLSRTKLMLVVDEAHFVFNQSQRMYSRPELVDWIDTAICNQGVPIALVTTPQFIVCMTRAADQVEWNYRQFRRRVKRWVKLPAANTEADIKAVAKSVFKKADAQMISKIAGYALLSKRDLSAVGDVASEVRVMIGTDDLSKATQSQIHRAIYDFLIPSDKTFLEGMAAARSAGRKMNRRGRAQLPEEPAPSVERDSQPAEPLPAEPRGSIRLPGSHARARAYASLIEA